MDQLVVASEIGDEVFVSEAGYDGPAGNRHEQRTFELPGSIWLVMFASYSLFFGGLITSSITPV